MIWIFSVFIILLFMIEFANIKSVIENFFELVLYFLLFLSIFGFMLMLFFIISCIKSNVPEGFIVVHFVAICNSFIILAQAVHNCFLILFVRKDAVKFQKCKISLCVCFAFFLVNIAFFNVYRLF